MANSKTTPKYVFLDSDSLLSNDPLIIFYNKGDIVESIRVLCNFIVSKCLTDKDYQSYSQAQYGAFKRAPHIKRANIIMNELKRNQLEVSTFIPDIIQLFDLLKVEDLNGSILKIIKILSAKINFAGKGIASTFQHNKLINFAKLATEQYDDNVITEPFTSDIQPTSGLPGLFLSIKGDFKVCVLFSLITPFP